MPPKIKKHFSLFMVSKSIQKPARKKKPSFSFELVLQDSASRPLKIPRFLDPVTCYHLYNDVCLLKFPEPAASAAVGLLSGYNFFKKVKEIAISPDCVSLSLEKTTDELHSWDFVVSRLQSLGDKDAYELGQVFRRLSQGFVNAKSAGKPNVPQEQRYSAFCQRIEDFCQKHQNTFYSLFRFRMQDFSKGLELLEIRHSRKTIAFFAGTPEVYAHLVLEQGVLDVWEVEEKDYYRYMADSMTNYLCESGPMEIFANTMEGFKVPFRCVPEQLIFQDEFTELVLVNQYELDEERVREIGCRRESLGRKGEERDLQLSQMLGAYYDSGSKDEKDEAPITGNSTYLAEKKRCGIKPIGE